MEQQITSQPNTTKVALLEAAKTVLLAEGFSGLSTRAIATAANTQMSQIRYHFGSKDGIVLALYTYMTDQLIERQSNLFIDPNISLSTKWEVACDYLDADIESGYVRVLQELMAVGYANEDVRNLLRDGFSLWRDLHIQLAEEFAKTYGSLGPFEPEDLAALIGSLFVGAEALILLECEDELRPVRRALRRLGKGIRLLETQADTGGT
ncbi:MAG: TetR/AcrR family transcriptional regulator [Rhodobacteraceae bacterium]|nr:TetR/AcrR family transcriptional regulator [Paracoccaceae bacterium]